MIPVVQNDFGFLQLDRQPGNNTFLLLTDTATGYKEASVVARKGNHIDSAKFVLRFLYELGYAQVQLQTDLEPANDSLKNELWS